MKSIETIHYNGSEEFLSSSNLVELEFNDYAIDSLRRRLLRRFEGDLSEVNVVSHTQKGLLQRIIDVISGDGIGQSASNEADEALDLIDFIADLIAFTCAHSKDRGIKVSNDMISDAVRAAAVYDKEGVPDIRTSKRNIESLLRAQSTFGDDPGTWKMFLSIIGIENGNQIIDEALDNLDSLTQSTIEKESELLIKALLDSEYRRVAAIIFMESQVPSASRERNAESVKLAVEFAFLANFNYSAVLGFPRSKYSETRQNDYFKNYQRLTEVYGADYCTSQAITRTLNLLYEHNSIKFIDFLIEVYGCNRTALTVTAYSLSVCPKYKSGLRHLMKCASAISNDVLILDFCFDVIKDDMYFYDFFDLIRDLEFRNVNEARTFYRLHKDENHRELAEFKRKYNIKGRVSLSVCADLSSGGVSNTDGEGELSIDD